MGILRLCREPAVLLLKLRNPEAKLSDTLSSLVGGVRRILYALEPLFQLSNPLATVLHLDRERRALVRLS